MSAYQNVAQLHRKSASEARSNFNGLKSSNRIIYRRGVIQKTGKV